MKEKKSIFQQNPDKKENPLERLSSLCYTDSIYQPYPSAGKIRVICPRLLLITDK